MIYARRYNNLLDGKWFTIDVYSGNNGNYIKYRFKCKLKNLFKFQHLYRTVRVYT